MVKSKATYTATALTTLLHALSFSTASASLQPVAFLPPHRHRHNHNHPKPIHTPPSPRHPTFALPVAASPIDEIPSDTTSCTTKDSSTSDPAAVLQSRNRLLALSTTLARASPTGIFLSLPSDKFKLQSFVRELEGSTDPSEENEIFREKMTGDWTLVCTATVGGGKDLRRRLGGSDDGEEETKPPARGWFSDKSKGAIVKARKTSLSRSGNDSPLAPLDALKEKLQKSVVVTQRVRATSSEDEIDRVDNVVEFTPLDTLGDVLPENLPLGDLFRNVPLNPLGVTNGKVVLIHKAEVESVMPVLRTKIAWTSSVVNVAGKSQPFSPEGSDLLGLNNLLGEFLATGTFDTLYVDDDVRVTRTSGPLFERLRVFVRADSTILEDEDGILESLAAELRVEEKMEVERSAAGRVEKEVGTAVDTVRDMGKNVRKIVEEDLEGVNDKMGEVMDDVVGRVQTAVEEDLKELGEAVTGLGEELGKEGGGNFAGAIGNVTKIMRKVPEDVRSVVEEDVGEVSGAVDKMMRDVRDEVDGDLRVIEDSARNVQKIVSGDEGEDEEIVNESDEDKDGDEEKTESVEFKNETGEEEKVEKISDAIVNVTKAVTKVPEDVKNAVEEDVEKLGEAVDEVVKDAQEEVEEDWNEIKESAKNLREVVNEDEETDDSSNDDEKP
eukprot:CAMPEP_0171361454 /NCGR_PEP_ID=MMETSP0879-20121228/1971_1 /TAXON_ID=67004 /ORGANISM="Thalassiosira weissflogii, Strain CCMP1336" /LENGTH=666 /DNA_ID=CAMNT_0011868119 /DNA_START=309 /DNA_END=2309 /DNA_ORIENTATION=-